MRTTSTIASRGIASLTLEILVKLLVTLAWPELLKKINTAISDGKLVNRDGAELSGSLDEALITDDGKIMYPVNDGIPVLLEGESVALNQLD